MIAYLWQPGKGVSDKVAIIGRDKLFGNQKRALASLKSKPGPFTHWADLEGRILPIVFPKTLQGTKKCGL